MSEYGYDGGDFSDHIVPPEPIVARTVYGIRIVRPVIETEPDISETLKNMLFWGAAPLGMEYHPIDAEDPNGCGAILVHGGDFDLPSTLDVQEVSDQLYERQPGLLDDVTVQCVGGRLTDRRGDHWGPMPLQQAQLLGEAAVTKQLIADITEQRPVAFRPATHSGWDTKEPIPLSVFEVPPHRKPMLARRVFNDMDINFRRLPGTEVTLGPATLHPEPHRPILGGC